ncbi:MAG: hypothetical protein JWO06_3921 [Bacteroidota bacterium]|nr:hypothetical protein [Bacteroidota bacterium]
MKKSVYALALGTIIAGMTLTSCGSKEQKLDDAKQNLQDAKEEVKVAEKQLNPEYVSYRAEEEQKITANETRITELRTKINKPGKAPLDDWRKKRIDELEQKNAELRSRLYGYEKERSDWEAFKSKFNSDMDKLGDDFRDFGKDKK